MVLVPGAKWHDTPAMILGSLCRMQAWNMLLLVMQLAPVVCGGCLTRIC